MAKSRTERRPVTGAKTKTKAKAAARPAAKPAAAKQPARKPAAVTAAETPAVTAVKPAAIRKAKAPAAAKVKGEPKGARAARPQAARRAAAASAGGDEPAAVGRTRSLVIVESPTKSRTLTKFLGRGFSVLASNGHIMDLPKSELGVDLENDFEPKYVPIRGKSAALAKIKTAAKTADRIFLAPDPDREGEAIARHPAGALQSAKRPIARLTVNEISGL